MIKNIHVPGKTVFSCEVFPPKRNDDMYEIFKTLDDIKTYNPDFISVTYGAGGSNSKKTALIAAYIQNICEIEAIAHLTAVGNDPDSIIATMDNLNKKGVQNVLALRGDQPRTMSDEEFARRHFKYAEEIIPIIHNHSEACVAAACYPEKHPESATVADDLKYLKQKVDTGVDFLLTQLFFDNEKYKRFVEAARDAGITVPIHAGIMPITSANQIGTTVQLSGSSVPTELSNLLAKYSEHPADMKKAGLDYAIRQINDLNEYGVDGIHLYIMNKAEVMQTIAENIDISR